MTRDHTRRHPPKSTTINQEMNTAWNHDGGCPSKSTTFSQEMNTAWSQRQTFTLSHFQLRVEHRLKSYRDSQTSVRYSRSWLTSCEISCKHALKNTQRLCVSLDIFVWHLSMLWNYNCFCFTNTPSPTFLPFPAQSTYTHTHTHTHTHFTSVNHSIIGMSSFKSSILGAMVPSPPSSQMP